MTHAVKRGELVLIAQALPDPTLCSNVLQRTSFVLLSLDFPWFLFSQCLCHDATWIFFVELSVNYLVTKGHLVPIPSLR